MLFRRSTEKEWNISQNFTTARAIIYTYTTGVDHCQTGNCCQDREHCQMEMSMQIDDQDQWLASYPGPYMCAVCASFQGGIRAWYPLSCACARFSQKSVK